ncbi:peptidyl-prolyl cis-trans isomerase G-like isoform X2 [Spodoptera frugiperda]|nr:peptidyl-prolyl cis-trans isomerase G-like isoform X2 [Spodoptera frugiperda]
MVPQVHQATAERGRQIQDLFQNNLTRNEFSNLLQSLIKLNEERVSVLKKISKLEDLGMLNEVLRSGDQKTGENADLKNLYLVILSKNQSNPTRRIMGEKVVELISSPVAVNKLQKRSIISTLDPVSNPNDGSPNIEPQKGINIAEEKAKLNLRTKNRFEIDDGSHSFATSEPSHKLQVELIDTKRLISSEEETDEIDQLTPKPPKGSKKGKKKDKKVPKQDRFEIITNADDYQDETSMDSFEAKDKSKEYTDIDLTAENERNIKVSKIKDAASKKKDDKQKTPEKNLDSVKRLNYVGEKEESESDEGLTNNKSVSIETYGEEKVEKEKTSRDYPEQATQHQTKNKKNKRNKFNKSKENTSEKPHYSNQNPPPSREISDEYSHKKPKITEEDSSEKEHRDVNIKKGMSFEVEQPYKRPKPIKAHPVEHGHKIHDEDMKSKENDKPSKVSKGNSGHYSDDDHRISHEDKSNEKDYKKERKDTTKHSNENSNHRIKFNSKEHKSNEEDKVSKRLEYPKEDEYISNDNYHKSIQKYSNKQPQKTSDNFSDGDHRISHEEKSYEKEYKREHKDKYSNEKSDHRIMFNSKEHKSREEDKVTRHLEYPKEEEYKSDINSHKSIEKYTNKQSKTTSDHYSDDDRRMSDKSSEHDLDSKHLKTSSNHNNDDHRISLDDFSKFQINNHETSVKHFNENDHRINLEDNKSYDKEPTNKHKSSLKYSNEMNKSYEKEKDNKPKHALRDSNEIGHKVASDENNSNKKFMGSKTSKEPAMTLKYSKYLSVNKPKNILRNIRSREDNGYKSHRDDIRHSEENEPKINYNNNQEKKNDYNKEILRNTKTNNDDARELEPHGSSYSQPRKDTPLSREDRESKSPSPGPNFSHETPHKYPLDKTNKDLPYKSDHKQPEDFSGHADDEKMFKPKQPTFEDDHRDKQSETVKDYGGEDYRSTEDYKGNPNSRVVMKEKPEEPQKHFKHPTAEGDEDEKPGAKDPESRKNFQKCFNKKALKLCTKSCISAYKNVCRKMKCTSRSKKALKKECKRSCKKMFSTKSSKYSDNSGSW